MHRRLVIGAAAACSAVFGVAAAADSRAAASQAAALSAVPVKLDRRNAQLRMVQVVFRHGARTPLTDESYLWEGQKWDVCSQAYEAVPLQLMDVNGGPAPSNAHDQKQISKVLCGGCSKGQLTEVGQIQALELGYWLRLQYIDTHGLLPASYKPGVIAARTTNFSRTRATLAGVLTGLYPGTPSPIPVTTSGDLDEILYADTKRCPHLKVLMSASEAMLKARWDGASRAPALKELQQQLDKLLNLPEGSWQRRWMMTDIHDAFTSVAAHGKQLPAGLTDDIKLAVNRLATEEISAFICPALVDDHGHAVLRLSMGRLLDTLLANMEQAQQQQQQQLAGSSNRVIGASAAAAAAQGSQQLPKMLMYSGHDSTIMPLLIALGADLELWPPYISNLVFELWELKPPTLHPNSNMAPSNQQRASSSSSSSAGDGTAAAAAAAPGQFVVRVLYNKEPMQLPGASEANPTLLELSAFKHQVLAPFILSQQEHDLACSSRISHDGALPHPDDDADADVDLMTELSLASAPGSSSGGSSAETQQQQQQQQQQGKK